jgi:crotonobetainyl-CoA:carnitine CoA-transferase CaiB-like acyl-CoA transferase
MANYSHCAVPHGVYPCQGEDTWCAIAIFTDEEWKAFCEATGNTDLISDPRFADLTDRKSNETILNELVSQWTRTRTAEEVMNTLQEAGIAAGVVSNAKTIIEDPHLWEAGFLKEMEHPEMGQCLHPNWPIRFSKTPARFDHAPLFGEHTECICRNILGMGEEEFLELVREDVLQLG